MRWVKEKLHYTLRRMGSIFLASSSFATRHKDAISLSLAVVAGIYVLVEYQLHLRDKKLDRTREYIERIESGSVHSARQWMDLHWINRRDLILNIEEMNYGQDANREKALELMEEYMKEFDESVAENADNIRNMMRIFYFYADLAKCVELGLCHGETACAMFYDDMGKFYVLHSTFVYKWRMVAFDKNFRSIVQFFDACDPGRR